MFKQLSASQTDTVEIILNGQHLQVPKGTTVAANALSRNLHFTRTTPVSGSKRAPFCMMGVCYDCIMVIDGQANQRACSVYVRDGMRIDTQQGVGPALGDSDSE